MAAEAGEARVFFMTNRKWDGTHFGHCRSESISYGEIGKGYKVRRYDDSSEFHSATRGYKRCFVFIHGFNNTFREAWKRFSKFSTKLASRGLSSTAFILLSWPSEGHDIGKLKEWFTKGGPYERDRQRMKDSVKFAAAVVAALVKGQPEPNSVLVMGHSMGGALLYRLLGRSDPQTKKALGRVMFMATDVRKNEMQEHFVSRIGRPATNYLCKGDKALELSRKNCGFHTRMGASSTKIKGVPDSDRQRLLASIKMPSKLARQEDPSNLHTYFLHDVVVADVVTQCTTELSPTERGLRNRGHGKGWSLGSKTSVSRSPAEIQQRAEKRCRRKLKRRAQKASRAERNEKQAKL